MEVDGVLVEVDKVVDEYFVAVDKVGDEDFVEIAFVEVDIAVDDILVKADTVFVKANDSEVVGEVNEIVLEVDEIGFVTSADTVKLNAVVSEVVLGVPIGGVVVIAEPIIHSSLNSIVLVTN